MTDTDQKGNNRVTFALAGSQTRKFDMPRWLEHHVPDVRPAN